jgi:spore coat polysaccharide biosynthesis protein SpsF
MDLGTAKRHIAIVVQARMASTRLPGKVLMEVNGRPLLAYQLERLEEIQGAHSIIVATTADSVDDPIVELCRRLGIAWHRGPDQDVLTRYRGAADLAHASDIIRVTADCPLIDPEVAGAVIERYLTGQCDYASNTLVRTFPRGLDVEIFSRSVLEEAFHEAELAAEREHVTLFIYRHPNRYRLCNVSNDRDEGHERWTVDTREDFELVRRILAALYPENRRFRLLDVRRLLQANPEWRSTNAAVEQKTILAP